MEPEMDRGTLSCPICLDLLKDPVTTSCGHSYCMKCIQNVWDQEDQKGIHRCPQCRDTFRSRPVLKKSTTLAALVEQLKKTGLQAGPADHCYAGHEDVVCDFCTGKKLNAIKSCLVCLASFCEEHLQPHYDVAPLKKHRLVEPSKNLQENICPRHDEVMKMFCRTDQKSICVICSMEEHRGHYTVSAAVERTERQRELEERRGEIHQRIQRREKDMKLLQQKAEAINHSADKTVEDSEKIFSELMRLLQKRSSDVKQQIRSQQEAVVSRVREQLMRLEQELTELERRDAELKQLSDTQDHNQFLLSYPSLSALSASTHSETELEDSSIDFFPPYFEDVKAAVSELRNKLVDVLRGTWTRIAPTQTEVDVSLSEPGPLTRAGLSKYSSEITLDPNTAHTMLVLSEGNRKVTLMNEHQLYPPHPHRFINYSHVLSRESLTGRCYWEVEWSGGVYVAVAYKDISRVGNESLFGYNDKSWALLCSQNDYKFLHNNIWTPISHPPSPRVGVFLDHSAGVLSFYGVAETMTLLHRVQTSFTQPLHAGVSLGMIGACAELCKPNAGRLLRVQ